MNDLKVTLSQRIKSNLDFYNKTTKQYNELSHIIDIARLENMDLAAYICTYHGSQNVGLILKKSTLELPTSLLLLIKDKIPAIMTNTLGNYILQDIMKEIAINTEIRLFVLSAICPSFVQIANDSSGTHCIQSLLRKTNDKQEIMILTNLIMFNFENLCFNNKSSHVVKKIIESIDEDLREDLNILFVNEITRLSVDPSGVCTAKHFIDYSPKYMKVILDVLYQECEELSRDKFGNFLIQYILDMCCSNMTKMSNSIIKKMRRKFKQLLFNKNAYYVALKVFRYTTENERKKIIKMLMNVKNIEVSWKNKIFRRVFKSIIDNLNDKEAKYAFELMSAKKIKIDKLKAIIYSKISQNQNL